MTRGFLKQFMLKAAVLTATVSMLLVFGPIEIEAAKPPPTPLSCSISPADGSTAAGVAIRFDGDTQGGKGSKSYSWDFTDGSGEPAASTDTSVDVTYNTVGGPFAVLLDVTDKQGTASCSTTVTVSQGGVNTPPVANDDGYTATINTTLNIAAPGVLGNDSDAESDPLTALLATNVSFGSLTLNGDGSFDYTPDTDFFGEDSFTYFADDGPDLSDATATVTITVEDNTPPTGEELFINNCRMCHGIEAVGGFAQRDIRTAGATRIRGAITRRSDMNFLGTRPNLLTDAEIDRIAAYLDTLPRGQDDIPRNGDLAVGEDQFRKSCTYCHSFGSDPNDPPRSGPDLMGVSTTYSDAFLGAWIGFPTEMIEAGAYQNPLDPYWMPDLGHSDINAWDIAQFLLEQENIGPIVDSDPVVLTDEQFEASRQVYFNRCAGCHGIYRGTCGTATSATGPPIDVECSQAIGTDGLGSILRYGTPRGMGNFGQSGILSEEQITHLAAYLQEPPPVAPELPWQDIVDSWDLIVPVAERPTVAEHSRNWENYTGVILRDAGQVAIFDGDSNVEIARLSTGFAVHILRSSSSGRYFYAIGRDGLVTMIDLWTTVPTIVANVKGCHDARSVESSKFEGYEDAYIIEGCYWPPQYVVYDGLTLEPIQMNHLPMEDIDGVTLIENRVASIVASHNDPVWVISLKESGYVGIVDYSDPLGLDFPLRDPMIKTAKALHDGGFDHTGNYFLVAANSSNKMVVVDLVNLELDALIDTGSVPHPGRGVNWLDPVYGWVNATPHIGEGKVTVYGADPEDRPDVAWTVVRTIPLPSSSGSLFIKSHPASPWVLVDMTKDVTGYDKDICAISKETGSLDRCFTVATNGPAVHFEFNMDGSEVWVSDWDPDGAVIVLDSTTLTEIRRFTGLPTPTGKFNVYNTSYDIY